MNKIGIDAYFDRLHAAVDAVDRASVDRFVDLLFDAYEHERTVFIVGNGGSAANASHFCQDLSKGTSMHQSHVRRLRALSLVDNGSWLTALGNDEGYEAVFVQQLLTFATPGDLLVIISGSGNSPNVLRAAEWARSHGVAVVAMSGFDGGQLHALADHIVHVPKADMGIVESVHLAVFHYVIESLARRLARHAGA